MNRQALGNRARQFCLVPTGTPFHVQIQEPDGYARFRRQTMSMTFQDRSSCITAARICWPLLARFRSAAYRLFVIAMEREIAGPSPCNRFGFQYCAVNRNNDQLSLVLSLLASSSVSIPFLRLVADMKRLAIGDTRGNRWVATPLMKSARMSRAVQLFQQNAIARVAAEKAAQRLDEATASVTREATDNERRHRLQVQTHVFQELGKCLGEPVRRPSPHRITADFLKNNGQIKMISIMRRAAWNGSLKGDNADKTMAPITKRWHRGSQELCNQDRNASGCLGVCCCEVSMRFPPMSM